MKKLLILIFSIVTLMLFVTSCGKSKIIHMDIDTNNRIFTTDMSEEELKKHISLTMIDEDGESKELKKFDLRCDFSEGLCEVFAEYKDFVLSEKVFFADKNKLSYEGDFVFYEYEDKDYLLQYNGDAAELTLPVRDKKYSIYDGVFADNATLQSVNISSSVIGIGENAFFNCKSLRRVDFSDSVKFVCQNAFSNSTALEYVGTSSLDAWCGIKFNFYDIFTDPDSNVHMIEINLGNWVQLGTPVIIIPDNMYAIETEPVVYASNPLEIAKSLYVNGEHITDLVIGESVTQINSNAFNGSDIKSVVIHSNVKSIASGAFVNCENLKRVEVNAMNASIVNSIKYAFGANCPAFNEYNGGLYLGSSENPYVFFIKQKDTACTASDIHPETKAICIDAFQAAKGIRSINLPDSVEFIAFHALATEERVHITLGNSVRYVGAHSVNSEPEFQELLDNLPEKEKWYYENDSGDKVFISSVNDIEKIMETDLFRESAE